ncbi:hypothetical protein Hanom_Chr16g01472541 [Helianthus anomalus]
MRQNQKDILSAQFIYKLNNAFTYNTFDIYTHTHTYIYIYTERENAYGSQRLECSFSPGDISKDNRLCILTEIANYTSVP